LKYKTDIAIQLSRPGIVEEADGDHRTALHLFQSEVRSRSQLAQTSHALKVTCDRKGAQNVACRHILVRELPNLGKSEYLLAGRQNHGWPCAQHNDS
jgi:hypothetical protein